MTANKLAEMAAQARQLAEDAAPKAPAPSADALNLAVYHLRAAASFLRNVAEYQAQEEKEKNDDGI